MIGNEQEYQELDNIILRKDIEMFYASNKHSNCSYCCTNNDSVDDSNNDGDNLSVLISFDYFDYAYLFNHQCFGDIKVCPRDYFYNKH